MNSFEEKDESEYQNWIRPGTKWGCIMMFLVSFVIWVIIFLILAFLILFWIFH